jgi:sugar/nucleoside kinase (ribokinase family)
LLFDPECAPAGRHALLTAAAKGMTTSVDAASAAPLARLGRDAFASLVQGTDLLFANEAEAEVLAGTTAPEGLLDLASGVIVKRGPDGADWAGRDGSRAAVPASPAAALADPTGAGDAFAAGFLGSWLVDGDSASALAAGARLGALAVSRFGGRP